MKINLRDGINHVQSHLDSVPGVVTTRLGQARHAVVTVTQGGDFLAVTLTAHSVKPERNSLITLTIH